MDIFRGDIFYIMPGEADCFDLKAGRPGIIVSNNMGNQHSDRVEVVYLTTKDKKPMPTHVDIICRQKSTALCEQITTVSKDRIGEFIKTCTTAEMKRIDEALMVSLGIVPDVQEYATEPQTKIPIGFRDEEKTASADSVVVERDLYKKLYEQLLDRITG